MTHFGAWPKQDIQAHIGFMRSFGKALSESGELVSAEGLADPKQASSCEPERTARRSPTACFRKPKSFSGVPFSLPTNQERAQRLSVVLHVLYLIFNEGYTSSAGPQLRCELSREAMADARRSQLALGRCEVAGLLALMLLTDARRAARIGSDGELIPLTKQDRTMWDRHEITEGIALLTAALSKGSIGAYQLQAAIAAVHDEAVRAEDTDWPRILALYDLLKRMSGNPMVMLNHAVATAMVHGPSAGLDLLSLLDADGCRSCPSSGNGRRPSGRYRTL